MRAATLYQGGVRAGILRFKYAGRREISQVFSLLLAQAWRQYPEMHGAQIIVPVPLHADRHRERGFNQAARLAEALSQRIHLPIMPNALRRIRRTRPQSGLDRNDRTANVRSAFACDPKRQFHGETVLLIDDVSTTLSTLRACASVLRLAGARRVIALVLARDPAPSARIDNRGEISRIRALPVSYPL